MSRLPHVSFWRLYGPAEATIASSFYHVPQIPDDPAADTPIGLPLGGERLYVLDRNLAILPPASAGDLYISGRGLSPGYWRDQDRTREAFLPNPIPDDPSPHLFRTGDVARLGEDGLYYLLGKADAQANPSSWERPKPPSSHSTGLNKWRSLP
jgi:non-ribosomal peptide synthetase component F